MPNVGWYSSGCGDRLDRMTHQFGQRAHHRLRHDRLSGNHDGRAGSEDALRATFVEPQHRLERPGECRRKVLTNLGADLEAMPDLRQVAIDEEDLTGIGVTSRIAYDGAATTRARDADLSSITAASRPANLAASVMPLTRERSQAAAQTGR